MGWKKSCVGLAVAGVFGSTILHSQLLAAGKRSSPHNTIPNVVAAPHVSIAGQGGPGDDQDQTMRRIQSRLRARYGYGPAEIEDAAKEQTQKSPATYSVRPQQRAGSVVHHAPPKPQQGLLQVYQENNAKQVAKQPQAPTSPVMVQKPSATPTKPIAPVVATPTKNNVVAHSQEPMIGATPTRMAKPEAVVETVPLLTTPAPKPVAAPPKVVEVATQPLPVMTTRKPEAVAPSVSTTLPAISGPVKPLELPAASVAKKTKPETDHLSKDAHASKGPSTPLKLPSLFGQSSTANSLEPKKELAAPSAQSVVAAPALAVVPPKPTVPAPAAEAPTPSTPKVANLASKPDSTIVPGNEDSKPSSWRSAREAQLAANRARRRNEPMPTVVGYEKGQVTLPHAPVTRDPNAEAEERAATAAKSATETYASNVIGHSRPAAVNASEADRAPAPVAPPARVPLAASKPSELPAGPAGQKASSVTPAPTVSSAAVALAKKHMEMNPSSPAGLSFGFERVKQGVLLDERTESPTVVSSSAPTPTLTPTPVAVTAPTPVGAAPAVTLPSAPSTSVVAPVPAVAKAAVAPAASELPAPPPLPSFVIKRGSATETAPEVAADKDSAKPQAEKTPLVASSTSPAKDVGPQPSMPSLPAMSVAKESTESKTVANSKETMTTTRPLTLGTTKSPGEKKSHGEHGSPSVASSSKTNADGKLPVSPFLKQGAAMPPVVKDKPAPAVAEVAKAPKDQPPMTTTANHEPRGPIGRLFGGKEKEPTHVATAPARKPVSLEAKTPTRIPVAPIHGAATNESTKGVDSPTLAGTPKSTPSSQMILPSLPEQVSSETKDVPKPDNLLARANGPTQVIARKPVENDELPKLPAPTNGVRVLETTTKTFTGGATAPTTVTTPSASDSGPALAGTPSKPAGDRGTKSSSSVPLQPLASGSQYLKPFDPVLMQHHLDTLRRGGSEIDRQKALKAIAQMSDWQDANGVGAVLRNIAMTDYNTHMRLSAVQMLGSMKNDRRMVMEALHISAEYDSDLTIRRTATQLLDRLASLPANEAVRR